SVIGVVHTPLAVQVTLAPLAAPVSSTSASGVLRVAPAALFQFAFATTPALSAAPIAVPFPTKLMLTAPTPLAAVTASAALAVRLSDPLVPVMVSVELPGGVPGAVLMSSVAVPDPLTEAGVNDAVAFAGSPLALRLTGPVNPFTAPTVTV